MQLFLINRVIRNNIYLSLHRQWTRTNELSGCSFTPASRNFRPSISFLLGTLQKLYRGVKKTPLQAAFTVPVLVTAENKYWPLHGYLFFIKYSIDRSSRHQSRVVDRRVTVVGVEARYKDPFTQPTNEGFMRLERSD